MNTERLVNSRLENPTWLTRLGQGIKEYIPSIVLGGLIGAAVSVTAIDTLANIVIATHGNPLLTSLLSHDLWILGAFTGVGAGLAANYKSNRRNR